MRRSITTATAVINISENGIDTVLHKKTNKIFKGVGNILFNEITEDGPTIMDLLPKL